MGGCAYLNFMVNLNPYIRNIKSSLVFKYFCKQNLVHVSPYRSTRKSWLIS